MTDRSVAHPVKLRDANRRSIVGPLCLVAFLAASIAFFGMHLAQRVGQIPTIWPANGFVLAVLLTARQDERRGYALTGLSAIAVGTLLSPFPLVTCLRLIVVNSCEVVVAFRLVRRFVGEDCDLSRPQSLWRFTLVAGTVAPAGAAVVNAVVKALWLENSSLPLIIASFMAHALGIITVTPFSLAVFRRDLSGLLDPKRTLAVVGAFTTMLGTTSFVFIQSHYPLLFLVVPPLIIIVLLFGLAGGSLGLFLTTLVAVGFTAAGSGPTMVVADASALERNLLLQLFAGVAAALVLVLSAVLAERDRALHLLRVARDELSSLATTDALTGLANRRKLDEVMAIECRRAAREQTCLSFLLLDVDRFKAFNDRYGHQAGDHCLQSLATTLKALFGRPSDLVGRYGGEEIAILLPATNEAGALRMANVARTAIQALAIPHVGNEACGGVVTVSIGCSTASPQGLGYDAKTLIGSADRFLYEAKRSGRDRVVSSVLQPVGPVPPVSPDEGKRLASVQFYKIGTHGRGSAELDDVARRAAESLSMPVGLVSMVGRNERVFLVGRHGVGLADVARMVSFCAHAITGDGPLVIEDAMADPRFRNNPLVTGEAGMRYCAGVPLIDREGHRLGALCVIDTVGRAPLTAAQRARLTDLASTAMDVLDRLSNDGLPQHRPTPLVEAQFGSRDAVLRVKSAVGF